MLMWDFKCVICKHEYEELVASSVITADCPKCNGIGFKEYRTSAAILTTIIPTYPGCKTQKAGYVGTSHANNPATKLQVGGWSPGA